MDRRQFLGLFTAGVAGVALEQAIPFGRVWSFPKKLWVSKLSLAQFEDRYLRPAIGQLFNEVDSELFDKQLKIGSCVQVRLPQRWVARDYFREHDQLIEVLKVTHPPLVTPLTPSGS